MLPVAKIFTVTKNETDLIEDFIIYHGNVFGFTNIIIIDNMSTCPIVKDVYSRYMKKGITVVNETNYEGNSQGNAFTKHMLKYKKLCKFLIGLDTDEFFIIDNVPQQNMVNVVTTYLNSFPGNVARVMVGRYLTAIPDPCVCVDQKIIRPVIDIKTFIYEEASPKKYIFRASKFISTVNGCHNGVTQKGTTVPSDSIVYCHFHNTGARRSIERAMSIVSGYGYTRLDLPLEDQLENMINVKSSTGAHRVLEYSLFLSRTLCLNEIIRSEKWTKYSCLEELSRTFPTALNLPVDTSRMNQLPSNWSDLYDDMIFYNPHIDTSVVEINTTVRDVICGNQLKLLKCPPPKKVALMLSGHFRLFDPRRKFWVNFKKKFGNRVDIYIHTWNESGTRSDNEWIDIGKLPPDFEEIRSVLKPVAMLVEDHADKMDHFSFQQEGLQLYYANFYQLGKSKDFSKNIGSQLYSIMKCWELVNESGIKYDLLVRLRADCIVDNFNNIFTGDTTFIHKNALVMNGSHQHMHPNGGGGCLKCDKEYPYGTRNHSDHSRDVCDIMYMGSPSVMKKACNMFAHRKELVMSFKKHNSIVSKEPDVKIHLVPYENVIGVKSSKIYETKIKGFYPERLIREYMKDYWVITDKLGLMPKIQYKKKSE